MKTIEGINRVYSRMVKFWGEGCAMLLHDLIEKKYGAYYCRCCEKFCFDFDEESGDCRECAKIWDSKWEGCHNETY